MTLQLSRGAFPATRMRRTRRNTQLRKLCRESSLSPSDLILPIFIIEGREKREPIASMPGVERITLDLLIEEGAILSSLGVSAVALFPVIEQNKKSLLAEESANPEGLIQRAIKTLKDHCPEILVISDIALDPYTSHGQDGILDEHNYVSNDTTTQALTRQALSHAEAGADVLAPSDMMDGRVAAIRQTLERANFPDTCILSYAAKYASNYYGPFRDAVGSSNNLGKADKNSYQMDPCNTQEALHECMLDLQEGADILMIKPGAPYLDIVREIKNTFAVPTLVYQVSGEYAMHQAAVEKGWINHQAVMMETLLCFKRAGADGIVTYFAKEAATLLNK